MQSKRLSPFTVVVTAICLSLVGLALFFPPSLRLMPSAEMPHISVSFSMNNATSQVVETEVTSVLEAMFSRMGGLQEITSTSGDGYGNIQLSFDRNVDIQLARFEVSSIVRQTWGDLPQGVSYPYIAVRQAESEAERPFMVYTVNASSDPSSIFTICNDVFKTGFADMPEINSVDVSGAQNKEWLLTYNVDALESLHVRRSSIEEALEMYQFDVCVSDYHLTIVDNDSVLDISNISVLSDTQELIPLSRLVYVEHREAPATSFFRINGLNSIYLSFESTEDANQINARDKIVNRLNELKSFLPADFEIHKVYDATDYISEELDKIYFRSGLTLLILLLFVWVTSLSWRQVVVIVISLTVNLCVAFIFYHLFGIGIHVYSMAGITISLNLIIDNAIIMSSHWRRNHNLKAVLPIIAATLTTITALSIIYFLDEQLRLTLADFASVLIINLLTSIAVALYLVPALLSLMNENSTVKHRYWLRRLSVRTECLYGRFMSFIVAHRKWMYVVVVLAFGTPIFLLPSKLEGEGFWYDAYNKTIGNEFYQNEIRPIVDVAFGGTLRLFVKDVYDGSYFSEDREVTLYVYATLPYGSTISQMDALVRRMESFLSTYKKEIKQFCTSIDGPQQASISITFMPEYEYSAFPYRLKSEIISKALQLGGGSWSVFGLPDNGFSNDVREQSGSYRIRMMGYNYDELQEWADSVKQDLLSYKRIKSVEIKSRFSEWKEDYTEYVLTPNMEAMARCNMTPQMLFAQLEQVFTSNMYCTSAWFDQNMEYVVLHSSQSDKYDVWSLLNMPFVADSRIFKVGDVCTLVKQEAAQEIVKIDQQYQLCLQYEYIGTGKMGNRVLERIDKKYKAQLPLGYFIDCHRSQYRWGDELSEVYLLIGMVIIMIVFITAILFNSLRYSFAIIGVIPISFVGLFLTFFLFGINFDQGGYAAMILLCGITVNASIYIVNEYLCQNKMRYKRSSVRAYLRSFRVKIVPILLTVLSTILGFIPFMVGEGKEAFWYPLAVGTIGGLVLSLVGVVFILPALCLKRRDVKRGE